MKKRVCRTAVFSLMMVLIVSAIGCAKGPTDQEVIQAINDTGLFSGGVEKFSLKSPIVIVARESRNRDGAWPVKVKMVVSYTMSGGKEGKPVEKTSVFYLSKSTDNAGKVTWTAK